MVQHRVFITVVIEHAFALPGSNEALATAVSQRYYAIVQGITLVGAARSCSRRSCERFLAGRPQEMSGGQRQRAAIARPLA